MRNAKITEEGIVIVKMTSMAFRFMMRELSTDEIVWDWVKPLRDEFNAYWHYLWHDNIRIYIGCSRREKLMPFVKENCVSWRLMRDRVRPLIKSMLYSIEMDRKSIYPISVKKLDKQKEKLKSIKHALKIKERKMIYGMIDERDKEEKERKEKLMKKLSNKFHLKD